MPRTLRPSDRIAHYRVVGPLGAGGMGEVYRATDQSLERDVALKVLPPELVQSEERVRRFTLEAKSASSLNHPHIVTIYEIGEDRVRGDGTVEPSSGSLHYIAMELVSGTTLAAKIHEEKADLKSLLGWLAQAAEGVAKAHAAGIVHRDLKPGNIMVSGDGYAKVLDFGLAKLTERAASEPELSAAATMTAGEQTSEGAVVGTAGYMAPEQVRGQAVDARADVFAFGCMLYEAATRKRPFAAETEVETMHRILHDVPAPVEELNPQAPAELRRLIRRCLAKDPNQRIDSMRTLALELREIVEEYEVLSASASSGSTAVASPLRRRSRSLAVWAAVVIAALGIAAAYAWLQRGPTLNPAMQTRQIEVPMKTIRYPGLSADGKWIALPARDDRDRWGIYYMRVQGGEMRPIVVEPAGNLDVVDISPDGTRIAFDVRPSVLESELRVVSVLGGAVRTIARRASYFKWRPDGQRVGYIIPARASRSRRLEVWTVRPDGSNATLAFVDSVTETANRISLAWSPDGKRVAWLRSFENRYNEIIVRDLATGRERQLTHDRKIIDEVTWTPQDEIFFSSNRGGPTNIWLMRSRGGTPVQVTRGTGPDLGVRVSADGRRLLYLVKEPLARFGWWDVVTGEEGRGSGEDQAFAIARPSAAGLQVAVQVQDPDALGSGALVLMNRDGSERRTVVPAEDKAQVFGWSPDGRQIAWTNTAASLGDTTDVHIMDVSTGEESSPPRHLAGRG